MTSIFDVAAYVLDKLGVMTTMKLEKLCYYSQAWSLVWDERRLFPERFEAWANGPVCPDLYHAHKGMFKITRGDIHGDPSNIDEDGTSTIDAVLNAYGKMGAYQLSELTHSERPWRDARGDLPQGAICNTEITEAAMAEYYGSLTGVLDGEARYSVPCGAIVIRGRHVYAFGRIIYLGAIGRRTRILGCDSSQRFRFRGFLGLGTLGGVGGRRRGCVVLGCFDTGRGQADNQYEDNDASNRGTCEAEDELPYLHGDCFCGGLQSARLPRGKVRVKRMWGHILPGLRLLRLWRVCTVCGSRLWRGLIGGLPRRWLTARFDRLL